MIPSIFPNDIIIIESLVGHPPLHSICLYETANQLILHRVIKHPSESGDLIYLQGDANLLPDPPVMRNQVMGYLVYTRKSPLSFLNRILYSISHYAP